MAYWKHCSRSLTGVSRKGTFTEYYRGDIDAAFDLLCIRAFTCSRQKKNIILLIFLKTLVWFHDISMAQQIYELENQENVRIFSFKKLQSHAQCFCNYSHCLVAAFPAKKIRDMVIWKNTFAIFVVHFPVSYTIKSDQHWHEPILYAFWYKRKIVI